MLLERDRGRFILLMATAIFFIMIAFVALVFAFARGTPVNPGWAEDAAKTWANQMKLEPTAIHCQEWNYRYDKCDLAVGQTIYGLECMPHTGCALGRK
jgi:hypothetical protein